MDDYELKPEFQEDAEDFEVNYSDRGCTCFLGNPPCSYCTHPGNPLCLEGADAWRLTLKGAVRKAVEESKKDAPDCSKKERPPKGS